MIGDVNFEGVDNRIKPDLGRLCCSKSVKWEVVGRGEVLKRARYMYCKIGWTYYLLASALIDSNIEDVNDQTDGYS